VSGSNLVKSEDLRSLLYRPFEKDQQTDVIRTDSGLNKTVYFSNNGQSSSQFMPIKTEKRLLNGQL
jgi:hypothetical protein